MVELEITTLLNVMVVLIAFLLLSAVFSKIAIHEMNLPTQAANPADPDKPPVILEVIVRKNSIEITDGKSIAAAVPKVNNEYDLPGLSERLYRLKGSYQDKQDVTILIEPDIEYNDLIHVMDAVKSADVKVPGKKELQRVVLFPQVSIGDAP
jgi:biopolymer transport protein ExbD